MSYLTIDKKIVTDDRQWPVAVQIDYRDWLQIEQLLNLKPAPRAVDFFATHAPLKSFEGTDQETSVHVTKRQISDIFPRQLENIKPFSREELYESM
jgi:hypothetical protein